MTLWWSSNISKLSESNPATHWQYSTHFYPSLKHYIICMDLLLNEVTQWNAYKHAATCIMIVWSSTPIWSKSTCKHLQTGGKLTHKTMYLFSLVNWKHSCYMYYVSTIFLLRFKGLINHQVMSEIMLPSTVCYFFLEENCVVRD